MATAAPPPLAFCPPPPQLNFAASPPIFPPFSDAASFLNARAAAGLPAAKMAESTTASEGTDPTSSPGTARASIFLATSRDGYIADKDGKVDWLNELQESHPLDPAKDGDGGFSSFLASVDALIMGRTTYETVLGFLESGIAPSWPYGELPTFVLSTRPESVKLPEHLAATVEVLRGGEVEEVMAAVESRLASRQKSKGASGGGNGKDSDDGRGANEAASRRPYDVYVDGGDTVRRFLDARLVRRAILTVVPATLGEGTPLFNDPKQREVLEEVEVRTFSNGFVQTTYCVAH